MENLASLPILQVLETDCKISFNNPSLNVVFPGSVAIQAPFPFHCLIHSHQSLLFAYRYLCATWLQALFDQSCPCCEAEVVFRSSYIDTPSASSQLLEAEANVIMLFVLPCWVQTLQSKFKQMFLSRAASNPACYSTALSVPTPLMQLCF